MPRRADGYTAAMETSEALPAGGLDLGDLEDVFQGPPPFLSLVLATDPRVANAAQRSDARWRSLRADAARLGAPEHVLQAIDPLIGDAHLRGEAFVVIATSDGVVHTEHGSTPPATDDVGWGPLPRLLPVVSWRQSSPPYLVVLTDRTDATRWGRAAGSNRRRHLRRPTRGARHRTRGRGRARRDPQGRTRRMLAAAVSVACRGQLAAQRRRGGRGRHGHRGADRAARDPRRGRCASGLSVPRTSPRARDRARRGDRRRAAVGRIR